MRADVRFLHFTHSPTITDAPNYHKFTNTTLTITTPKPRHAQLLYKNEYPPTDDADGKGCVHLDVKPGEDPAEACGLHCQKTDECAYFFVYTIAEGQHAGQCCPKSKVRTFA